MNIKNQYLFDSNILEYQNIINIFNEKVGFEKIDLLILSEHKFFKKYKELSISTDPKNFSEEFLNSNNKNVIIVGRQLKEKNHIEGKRVLTQKGQIDSYNILHNLKDKEIDNLIILSPLIRKNFSNSENHYFIKKVRKDVYVGENNNKIRENNILIKILRSVKISILKDLKN